MNVFHRCAQLAVGHFIQLCAGQHSFGGNAHPAANGNRHIRLIPRQDLRRDLQAFQRLDGRLCGFFGSVEERQIPHQNQVTFIGGGDLILLPHDFLRHGDDLHAVLQHLIHHGRNTLPGVLHGHDLAPVGNEPAPGNDMRNIALYNELVFPVCVGHKGADDLAGIVKGNLVRLLMPGKQLREMRLPSRHGLTGSNGVVNRIAYPGVIDAVQKCKIQHLAAFVAQHIHVVFQQNTLVGQRTGLVHAQYIHAAEALHGVDVLDDGLLAAHGKASPRKAGSDDHGQHLRHQSHRHRQGKGEGFQPLPSGDAEKNKHKGDHHRHKVEHDPCDGVCALLEGGFLLSIRLCEAAVESILSHRQHDALALAADDRGCHECEIFKLCQRFGIAVAKGTAALFQNGAFAGDGGLGHKEVCDPGQPNVRRNTIPRRQQDNIAHHQLFRRYLQEFSATPHRNALVDQPVKLLGCVLCPQLLNEPDRTADEDHGKDDDGGGCVFAEIRGKQHIRHQRDDPKNKEDDIEGIDKRPPQPAKHGVILSPRKAVRAELLPHDFHLLAG